MKKKDKTTMCLYPECGRLQYARGLCFKHYHAARLLVRRGATSWESMEASGKCNARKLTYDGSTSKWFLEGVK